MSALDYLLERARLDPVVFVQVVVKDEISGQPLDLTDDQKHMLRFWHAHERTVLHSYPEAGKSTLITAYGAFRAGQDATLRIGIISGTEGQSQRDVQYFAIHVSRPEYAWVFPDRRIERQTADAIWLTGRPETMKAPSVVGGSPDLSSLQGRRLSLALVDDVVPLEAVYSQSRRDRDDANMSANIGSRLAPGGQIHCVGVALHPDDQLHRMARRPGYHYGKYPVLRPDGSSAWESRWPLARAMQRKLEIGPIRFAAAYLCEAMSEASLCFPQASIDRALSNGLATQFSPIGGRCIVGVDPAFTVTRSADESGICLVSIDVDGYRHLAHVEGIRVHHEALVARVVELCRINKAVCYIEKNAGGGILCDMISKHVPCKGLNTSAQSKAARIEAAAMELASGRWVFRQPLGYPSPELTKLVSELQMLSADPGRHLGDRASCWLIAGEGARAFENRPKGAVLNASRSDGGVWSFSRITR